MFLKRRDNLCYQLMFACYNAFCIFLDDLFKNMVHVELTATQKSKMCG